MLGISRLAAQMVASQVVLSSIVLVSQLVYCMSTDNIFVWMSEFSLVFIAECGLIRDNLESLLPFYINIFL
jgi:hypothetical protein